MDTDVRILPGGGGDFISDDLGSRSFLQDALGFAAFKILLGLGHYPLHLARILFPARQEDESRLLGFPFQNGQCRGLLEPGDIGPVEAQGRLGIEGRGNLPLLQLGIEGFPVFPRQHRSQRRLLPLRSRLARLIQQEHQAGGGGKLIIRNGCETHGPGRQHLGNQDKPGPNAIRHGLLLG